MESEQHGGGDGQEYVRYADWLTFSWMLGLVAAGLLLVGLDGFVTGVSSTGAYAGPPMAAASKSVVAVMPQIVAGSVGLMVAIIARDMRQHAELCRPDGLEVPA